MSISVMVRSRENFNVFFSLFIIFLQNSSFPKLVLPGTETGTYSRGHRSFNYKYRNIFQFDWYQFSMSFNSGLSQKKKKIKSGRWLLNIRIIWRAKPTNCCPIFPRHWLFILEQHWSRAGERLLLNPVVDGSNPCKTYETLFWYLIIIIINRKILYVDM